VSVSAPLSLVARTVYILPRCFVFVNNFFSLFSTLFQVVSSLLLASPFRDSFINIPNIFVNVNTFFKKFFELYLVVLKLCCFATALPIYQIHLPMSIPFSLFLYWFLYGFFLSYYIYNIFARRSYFLHYI